MNIETLKLQIETFRKTGLDTSHLQQQLDELESPVNNPSVELDEPKQNEISLPVPAAPSIQDTEAQEKELDEDIDEPSETQKIVVAPAIESYQSAWTLACCYLWLTSKNMNERKGVMFNTPRPFQELANKNFFCEVPDQAEWTTWNRLHGSALETFMASKESAEEYERTLKEVMCLTPHRWREKYLANSELSTK